MDSILFIIRILYILFTGIVLPYFWEVPYYVFIILGFVNALLSAILLEWLLSERIRIRNHLRCAFAIYVPIFLFTLLLTIFIIFTVEMYIIVFAFLLLFIVLCILFRKQSFVPYLLLVSNMTYKKAKENAQILYKQRKTENTMCVVVYLSVLFVVSIIQYNFIYMGILKFNMLSVVPLLLVDLYASLCCEVRVRGNDENKGKFSFSSCFGIGAICIFLPLLTLGNDLSIMVKARTIHEASINGYTYRVATLKMNYQDYNIEVSKAKEKEADLKFLKTEELPVLPVDYEIFYVDEILDRENVSGTTILEKDKAISYVTNGKEDDILSLVFYHEYAHVLFHYMDDYEKLLKQYEKLRIEKFDEKEWSTYYVSQYAISSALEDMCEEYAFYMTNEKYHDALGLKEYEIHKNKIELIHKFMIEEYNYDFYHKELKK